MKTFTKISYLYIIICFCSCKTKQKKEVIAKELNKPNIIFILADDLGWGDVGYNGQTKIKTPNIDQLAKEGIIV